MSLRPDRSAKKWTAGAHGGAGIPGGAFPDPERGRCRVTDRPNSTGHDVARGRRAGRARARAAGSAEEEPPAPIRAAAAAAPSSMRASRRPSFRRVAIRTACSGRARPNATVFQPAPSTCCAASRSRRGRQIETASPDLLGAGVTINGTLEADTALDGFASIGAARVSLSATATEQFDTAAFDLAHQALSNTTTRAARVGCAPAGTTDNACASAFLTAFGRRARGGAICTSAEVATYATIATTAAGMLGDFWGGLEYGLAGLARLAALPLSRRAGHARSGRARAAHLLGLRAREPPRVPRDELDARRHAARRRQGRQARDDGGPQRRGAAPARFAARARRHVELLLGAVRAVEPRQPARVADCSSPR